MVCQRDLYVQEMIDVVFQEEENICDLYKFFWLGKRIEIDVEGYKEEQYYGGI